MKQRIVLKKLQVLIEEHLEDTEASVLQVLREMETAGNGFSKRADNQQIILETVKAAHTTLDV